MDWWKSSLIGKVIASGRQSKKKILAAQASKESKRSFFVENKAKT